MTTNNANRNPTSPDIRDKIFEKDKFDIKFIYQFYLKIVDKTIYLSILYSFLKKLNRRKAVLTFLLFTDLLLLITRWLFSHSWITF